MQPVQRKRPDPALQRDLRALTWRVSSKAQAREDGFLPLNVEYEGKALRPLGPPRPLCAVRPLMTRHQPTAWWTAHASLFPKENARNDVCLTMTVMSLDPDCSPEMTGMVRVLSGLLVI